MADSAADIYDAFIAEQVEAEEARKTSIESRAGVVITTSGAIVTLLFGLAALVTKQEGYRPPASITGELKTALLFFALAVGIAVLTNVPLPYTNVKPAELQRAVRDLWGEASETAKKRTSATRVKFLYRAQQLNQIKGYGLFLALASEVVAIVYVALAVKGILLQGGYVS